MQIFLPFARISAARPSCASGDGYVARHGHGDMVGHVSGGARVGLERERLDVDGHRDVGNPATAHGSAAGKLDDILDMRRSHDARVVDADIHEQLVELHILLGVGGHEVVILQAGNGEHRCAVELGVVEPVQQMDAARTRGGQADS